jgi:NADH-quinone oxidoreductase subunit L
MSRAFHATEKDWDTQDMRNMGGLRKIMPITWATMWIATLAISGVWPFAGFFSKDEIIWQAAANAVGPYAGWYKIFWVMALIAAMLTAFYMTRLMVMTFHGPNRSGKAEREHIQEVPVLMWVPLAVLAVLSVVGGWINVPSVVSSIPVIGWIPSSEWLHHWLEPVTATADGVLLAGRGALAELSPVGGGAGAWAVGSFAIAVAVIFAASRLVGSRAYQPAHDSPEPAGLWRVLNRKWYVDELYDAIVVRPILATSRALWKFIDDALIDGAVNGIGHASRLVGWAGARLQTGQLNTYAFAVVIGVLILLGFMVL